MILWLIFPIISGPDKFQNRATPLAAGGGARTKCGRGCFGLNTVQKIKIWNMIDILLLIVGLVLILTGANYLVDGASAIAKRAGLSDFIIGLTIVGIGTSTPEMVVSFASAIKGNADIAVGNVLGSNIFNTLMILGATALFSPIRLTSNNVKKEA